MRKTLIALSVALGMALGSSVRAQTAAPSPSLKPESAKVRKHHKVHKGAVHKKKNMGRPKASPSQVSTPES